MLQQTTHPDMLTSPRMPHGDPLTSALALAEAHVHCVFCASYHRETRRIAGWEPSGLPSPDPRDTNPDFGWYRSQV